MSERPLVEQALTLFVSRECHQPPWQQQVEQDQTAAHIALPDVRRPRGPLIGGVELRVYGGCSEKGLESAGNSGLVSGLSLRACASLVEKHLSKAYAQDSDTSSDSRLDVLREMPRTISASSGYGGTL